MPFTPGSRIGPYEIVAPVGAGGMGEVYRAHDSHLKREVAIKVLPAAFSRDPERLRRFQQEAQAVAALNHPNILAIYQLGEHEGSPYIVMEYLEGETLRTRLRPGALPVRKSIELAEQLANGLAAAHDKGIVHRDLKPENIIVTRDGRVKILDFGLAKLKPEAVTPDDATLASQTEPGVVMGTVAYMSPEQVRGQPTNHRSDLFSLGTILYEMLTGKRAFQGATSVETMNAILKEDPPEQTEIARNIPPALCRIVDHCLEKNPAERFQSARDVAFALGALSGSVSSASSAVRAGASQVWWPRLRLAAEVALAAVVIVLTLLIARHRPEAPEAPVVASILPPPGDGFWANITQPAAISPDGKFLAVIAMRNGHTQLWLRRLDAADAQPIAGSEGASNPFWSPDSRHIAFFVPGKLRRADISGGSVTDICPSGRFGMGGAWSTRGIIIFSIFGQALRQVPDNGGVPEPIPGNSLPNDALTQMWPAFLPDGKHFLYLDWRYSTNDSRDNVIFIGSLDGEKPRRLPLTGTNAHYSLGYLLFSRDGDLVAQKFDLSRAELSGAILPVARNIQYDTFFHDGMFTVSDTGVIVYGNAGAGENTELTWMDRTGRALGTLGEPGSFQRPSISPDGTRVAVGVRFTDAQEKIWIYDVERNTRIPIVNTQSGSGLYSPVWSPDGKQVAYRTTMGKTSMLLAHNSDGSGEESQPGSVKFDLLSPTAWSPDGRYLALDLAQFQGRQSWQESLRVVQVETGKAVLEIPDAAISRFSPDGHWLAFAKEEDGQVYVTQFPSGGARIAVSSAGGVDPRWRGDGQELFYIDHDLTVVSVQVRETPNEFRVLSSQPLFRLQLPENVGFYDVTRDGKRFLVNIRTTKEQSAPLTLITNWTAHLQQETK